MALPKKNSRLLEIDNTTYRWMVGPNDGFNQFFAEKEEVKGCRLEVYFDMYINEDALDLHSKDNLLIIKPGEAKLIIEQALKLGWNPDVRRKPIVFNLKGDKLVKRI